MKAIRSDISFLWVITKALSQSLWDPACQHQLRMTTVTLVRFPKIGLNEMAIREDGRGKVKGGCLNAIKLLQDHLTSHAWCFEGTNKIQ